MGARIDATNTGVRQHMVRTFISHTTRTLVTGPQGVIGSENAIVAAANPTLREPVASVTAGTVWCWM